MFKKLSLLTLSLALAVPTFAQEKKVEKPCGSGIHTLACLGGALIANVGWNNAHDSAQESKAVRNAGRESRIQHITKQSTNRLFNEMKPGDRIVIKYAGAQPDGAFSMGLDATTGRYIDNVIEFETAKEAKNFLATLKPEQVTAIARTRTVAQHKEILKAFRNRSIAGVATIGVGALLIGGEVYRYYSEREIQKTEAQIPVESYQQATQGSLRDTNRQAYLKESGPFMTDAALPNEASK